MCAQGQDLADEPLAEQRLRGLVALLDDELWEVREQATRMIGNVNEGFELDMLTETMQRDDLSPEARLRLRMAARGLFGQTTKAGLGVGFGAVRDGGIEIRSVVQEVDRFPAAGRLMPGDLIVGAGGAPLTSSEDLRAMILSHTPDEKLNLLIQRGDDVLDMDLPLGSYQMLTGAAPISPGIADRAIDLRWARRGISIPGDITIGQGISADDWVSAGYPEEPGSFRASNARRAPRVVSPGSARDVYVGVGVLVRGRIEPWSNKTNAELAMDQARRIELSRQMNIARLQVRLLKGGADALQQEANKDPTDGGLKVKLSEAIRQLRGAQRTLEELTDEFDSLEPTP